jgi:hypothetical protein
MMIATFMIEWLKIDGLYKIPRGLHVGIGLHTILHYMGAVRHHRWIYATPDGQLGWFWLRRTGPAGGVIGATEDVRLVKPKGLALNRSVGFDCGSQHVELFAPRTEADRLVSFLDRP